MRRGDEQEDDGYDRADDLGVLDGDATQLV